MKFDSEMRIKMDKILEQDGLLQEVKTFAEEYTEYLYERKRLVMLINVNKLHNPIRIEEEGVRLHSAAPRRPPIRPEEQL